jgi:uncharacterized C2H2 Zn-finger protein
MLTPHTIVIDVNHGARIVPREGVEITDSPPRHWSIVPRPRDAIRVPQAWGDRYALCPACRNRTAIKSHPATLHCPRCDGVFQIAWDEVERS